MEHSSRSRAQFARLVAGTLAALTLAVPRFASPESGPQVGDSPESGQQVGETPYIDVGATVRVTRGREQGRGGRLLGRFVAIDGGRLFLQPADRSTTVDLPLARVERLEIYRGRRVRTGRGAAIGSVAGGLAGVAIGRWGTRDRQRESGDDEELVAFGLSVLGGAAGAATGAIAGALIGSRVEGDSWESMPLTTWRARTTLRLAPTRGGVAVSVSVRFASRARTARTVSTSRPRPMPAAATGSPGSRHPRLVVSSRGALPG